MGARSEQNARKGATTTKTSKSFSRLKILVAQREWLTEWFVKSRNRRTGRPTSMSVCPSFDSLLSVTGLPPPSLLKHKREWKTKKKATRLEPTLSPRCTQTSLLCLIVKDIHVKEKAKANVKEKESCCLRT